MDIRSAFQLSYVDRPEHDPYTLHKSTLWPSIKKIETGYGLSELEQACLRAAAYLLVDDKAGELSVLLDLTPDVPTANARKDNFDQQYMTCVL